MSLSLSLPQGMRHASVLKTSASVLDGSVLDSLAA